MIDAPRVLRPLSEAGDAIDSLVTYSRPAELAEALEATWTAVERSLRLLLRSDTAVPEEHRLAALSPDDLPLPRLVEALRQRNLISMELAGRAHELAQAAERASHGDVRASDADVGRQVVAELRREVTAAADSPIQEVAHHAVETGAVQEPPQAVPMSRGRRRPPLVPVLIVLVIAGAVVGLVYWLTHRGGGDGDAVGAFREGRLGVAEQKFRATVQDNPEDVLALLRDAEASVRGRMEPAAIAREYQWRSHTSPVRPQMERCTRRVWGWLCPSHQTLRAAHSTCAGC